MATDVDAPEALAPAPPEREPSSLFKYSTWVHAGHGAEDCSEVDEEAGTCTCGDSSHFHAWVRLPNPFQHREIRERSQAAKARKLRQLRNPGTDANDILESALDDLAADGDTAKLALVEELLAHEWWRDYLKAVREVRDIDDTGEGAGEDAKLYEHVEQDQARFARLSAQDPADRNDDEFNELQVHLKAYQDEVDAHVAAYTNPKRTSLENAELNDLLDQVRRKRIETEAQQEFMHHFSVYEWLACTFKQREGETYFRDLAHLELAAPEVVAVLQSAFSDLERTAQEAQGN